MTLVDVVPPSGQYGNQKLMEIGNCSIKIQEGDGIDIVLRQIQQANVLLDKEGLNGKSYYLRFNNASVDDTKVFEFNILDISQMKMETDDQVQMTVKNANITITPNFPSNSLKSLYGLIQTKKTQKRNTYTPTPIMKPVMNQPGVEYKLLTCSSSSVASSLPTYLEEELSQNGNAKQNDLQDKKRKYVDEERRDTRKRRKTRSSRSLERGFTNNGNTCYINAVLFALVHQPRFVQDLKNEALYDAMISQNGKHKTSVYLAMVKLFEKFEQNRTRAATNPESLKNRMAIVQDIFKGNEQQDAQEFLVNCLDTINEEVSSIDDIDEPIINPVTQNITGEEFFSFKCVQCGHESTKTQEFTDLSIHIDQNTDQDDSDEETVIDARTLPEPVVDIQQLLNRMFQQEEIISRYCEACGHSLARSKREICVLPEVLILHLARFEAKETNSSGYVKKTERIGINETIRTLNARDVYEIAAVIGHEGSTPRQGHYYTAVRSYEKKMWLDCDDEEINEISKQNALSSAERQSTCYLLFYRKLEKQIE